MTTEQMAQTLYELQQQAIMYAEYISVMAAENEQLRKRAIAAATRNIGLIHEADTAKSGESSWRRLYEERRKKHLEVVQRADQASPPETLREAVIEAHSAGFREGMEKAAAVVEAARRILAEAGTAGRLSRFRRLADAVDAYDMQEKGEGE